MKPKGTLLLFFLLVQSSAGICQFKNIMLDDLGGQSASELTIAVNPRRPDNIVAASDRDYVYITTDAGKTWSKSQIAPGKSGDPVLIADEKGNFIYFHLSDPSAPVEGEEAGNPDRIVFQRSHDGGVTWSPAESVGLNPKHPQRQWAATDARGNLYVAWTAFDDADAACQSNIMFSMSKNGKKWTDPVLISQAGGNCMKDDGTAFGGIPVVSVDGKVFVSWSSHEKIFLDRSFNGGEWWLSNDIVIASQKGGSRLEIPGHGQCNNMPVLVTDNSKSSHRGSLYLVWADQRNGEADTDIWFTRSFNFGDNWSSQTRVNDDDKGKHQYMPWLTIDSSSGYIYIVYYDRRNYDDDSTDVYLAWSKDGGASFKNVLISESPFIPNGVTGDYINISAQKGVIAPIWSRHDGDKVSIWTAVIKHEDLEKKR